VEATAPAAPNAILLGLAAAGLAGAGDTDVAITRAHISASAACSATSRCHSICRLCCANLYNTRSCSFWQRTRNYGVT
jgi:hypothetical protein